LHTGLSNTATVLSTDVDISSTAITSDSVQEMALPVLDLSDPAQLLELITSGDLFVEPQPFQENDTNDISLMEIDCSNNPSTSDLIESAFMPPKLESRPNHDRIERPVKKTSHTLLTSDDILQQKKIVQLKKITKANKKAAKTKKENK
jgi:hypothetical protein